MVRIEHTREETTKPLFLIFTFEWWPDELELERGVGESVMETDKIITDLNVMTFDNRERTIVESKLPSGSLDIDILEQIENDINSRVPDTELRGIYVATESVQNNRGLRNRALNK